MQPSPFFPVLIVGGGPTGLALAHFIGSTGTAVLVLESQEAVFPIPRATHLDEETLRNFQLTGLGARLFPFTSPFGRVEIVNHWGKRIFKEEVAAPYGLHGNNGSRFFDQPAFEQVMEQGLSQLPAVSFRRGIEVTDIVQDSEKVNVICRERKTGETLEFQAAWVVGCDGGRSLVRSRLGISLVAHAQPREWIIVDTLLHTPADAGLLPDSFQYRFDRSRLTIYAHGHGLNHRWEFQLKPGEAKPADSEVLQWLKQYIPEDRRTVVRIASYMHQALVAETWQQGRVLLAGDAAHMMPPAAGQGLCSGIRDAANLGWKLAAVANGAAASLLQTYEAERKPHLQQILKRTLFFNTRVQGEGRFQQFTRAFLISTIEAFPALKNYLKKQHEVPLAIAPASAFPQQGWAGKFFPQWMDSPFSGTDDLFGYEWAMISKQPMPGIPPILQSLGIAAKVFPASCSPAIEQWMQTNRLQQVVIRPDKIIFYAE